jgi:hypothetical protein
MIHSNIEFIEFIGFVGLLGFVELLEFVGLLGFIGLFKNFKIKFFSPRTFNFFASDL